MRLIEPMISRGLGRIEMDGSKRNPFLLAVLIALFASISPSLALGATITVNTASTRQTIAGIGGNYCFYKSDSSLGRYTLNNLNPQHVRVEMDLNQWEPINDNGDPNTINWSSFKDTGQTHVNFVQMQDFKNRGIPIIVASIWDVPNWMVQNPTDTQARVIPPSMYDEAVESIAAYLLYARDTYGVTIHYISFNEPNYGYQTYFSSSTMIAFIKKAGPRFAALGLTTKWLIGDVTNASTTVSYVTPILQDSSIAQYLGPAVSTHSWNWDGAGASDAVFSNIYTLAAQYGKTVWVEEVGLDSSGWMTSGYTSTWTYAIDLARLYYRIIKYMRGTALTYWEYGSDFELLNPSSLTPYPAYYVVKQLADLLLPGTSIVETSSSGTNILVFAGIHRSTGNFMIQMINTSSATETANITGLPNAALTMKRTNSGEYMVTVGTYTPSSDGALSVSLRPQSISTLYGTVSSQTQEKIPIPPSGISIQ
jgi:O-glycosyl hydrolase